jgi:hypothetical protein
VGRREGRWERGLGRRGGGAGVGVGRRWGGWRMAWEKNFLFIFTVGKAGYSASRLYNCNAIFSRFLTVIDQNPNISSKRRFV